MRIDRGRGKKTIRIRWKLEKTWPFLVDGTMETGGAGRDGDREQRRGGNEDRVSITQLGPTGTQRRQRWNIGTATVEREIAVVRFTGVFVEFYTMTAT
jgi:hypothetical protein